MFKNLVLCAFAALAVYASPGSAAGPKVRQGVNALHNNNCVRCHSKITAPGDMSSRYLDWFSSPHKTAGVGCNQCHGGDPVVVDEKKAHQGVLPRTNINSRLSDTNTFQTCGNCHRAIVNSFVESEHFDRLKTSGMAPSCTSCHTHMASSVARLPNQGEALCAFCHNSVGGVLQPNPELVKKAKGTLDAMSRTQSMVNIVTELFNEADRRKIKVTAEKDDFALLKQSLFEARVGWHAFRLDSPRVKADKSFQEAVNLRDRLAKKLAEG